MKWDLIHVFIVGHRVLRQFSSSKGDRHSVLYSCDLVLTLLVRDDPVIEDLTQGEVPVDEEDVRAPSEPDASGKRIQIEILSITPISVQIAVNVTEDGMVWCDATTTEEFDAAKIMKKRGSFVVRRDVYSW